MGLSKIREGTPPPELPRHLDEDFGRLLKFSPSIAPDSIISSPKGETIRIDPPEQSAFINSLLLLETNLSAAPSSQERLRLWLRYVQGVMRYTMIKTSITNPEHLISIGTHEETIISIAALLSHNADVSETMVKQGDVFYTLSEDGTHIVAKPEARAISGMEDHSHTTLGSDISPSDEFQVFGPWAVRLAAHSVAIRHSGKIAPKVPKDRFQEGKLFDDMTFEETQSA